MAWLKNIGGRTSFSQLQVAWDHPFAHTPTQQSLWYSVPLASLLGY